MWLFLPALAVVVVLMWYAAALSIASAVAVAIPIVVVQNFTRQVHHMFDVWYNYKQSEERRAHYAGVSSIAARLAARPLQTGAVAFLDVSKYDYAAHEEARHCETHGQGRGQPDARRRPI